MVHPAHRRQLGRLFTVIVVAGVGLVVPSATALGSPSGSADASSGVPGLARSHTPGLAPVAQPRVAVPKPLPRKAGTVPLRADLRVARQQSGIPRSPRRTVGNVTAGAERLQLRALILGVDSEDSGVAAWRATLDRVGAAYDVLYSRSQPLNAATLVGTDGVGRYNAILLTNSMLLYGENGGYYTALNVEEWNRLWAYERDFGVRQVALYTTFGTWPEDYCLIGAGEGGVTDTPLKASLTTVGADVFDYLRPTATVPITQSYVYRSRIAAGCSAEPVLRAGDDILAVRSTSTDGRERLALTFTSNQYALHTQLLAYGLFRWASKGLYLGEQRHFLNVDVDDWFNGAVHFHPDGHVEYSPGYRLSGREAYNLNQRQIALRAEHPSAADFTFTLALNGRDADLGAGSTCSPSGGVDTLTATSRCLADKFRWLNHTHTHVRLDNTSLARTSSEISANQTTAAALGLDMPDFILKTPEYSGLGVYYDDPANPGVAVDHGLAASNPNLIAAAVNLGVRYLHGNMSYPSHQPTCFNCGIVHPTNAEVMVVPDWPTNIAFHTTTPEEETAFYNSFYGPDGQFPYWPQNLTYEQILDYEADLVLSRMAAGSLYAHTFHIANVRDYDDNRTLVTDWLDRVLDKYDAYYQVPVLSPDWPALAEYARARTEHFAGLSTGVTAVYDRVAGTVSVTSPQAAAVTVSGVRTPDAERYGSELSAPIMLAEAGTISVPAAPRA